MAESKAGPRFPHELRFVRAFCNGASRVFSPTLFSVLDTSSCRKVQIGEDLDGIEVVDQSVIDPRRVILYLHGGGHFFGSVWTHREFLGRLSAATRAHVVAVNYRLAPEHPFPAGLDDTFAAWQWLCEQRPDASIAVAGDSAGGNLAFALLVRLAQAGMKQPIACVGISPWLDLECARGRIFTKLRRLYLQGHPAADPLASPALADLKTARKFPPVIIHADENECLSVDAREMAELCQRAGRLADFKLYTGTTHGFQVWPLRFLEETKDSLKSMSILLDKYWRCHGCHGCHARAMSKL